jgi:hypothetical protein
MEGDRAVRGHNSFGKFMSQYHDLKRAYTKLETREKAESALLYEVHTELRHIASVLRLHGLTEPANRTNKLRDKVDAVLIEVLPL